MLVANTDFINGAQAEGCTVCWYPASRNACGHTDNRALTLYFHDVYVLYVEGRFGIVLDSADKDQILIFSRHVRKATMWLMRDE